MKTTRRGLFGVLGGAAATAGMVKATQAKALTDPRASLREALKRDPIVREAAREKFIRQLQESVGSYGLIAPGVRATGDPVPLPKDFWKA